MLLVSTLLLNYTFIILFVPTAYFYPSLYVPFQAIPSYTLITLSSSSYSVCFLINLDTMICTFWLMIWILFCTPAYLCIILCVLFRLLPSFHYIFHHYILLLHLIPLRSLVYILYHYTPPLTSYTTTFILSLRTPLPRSCIMLDEPVSWIILCISYSTTIQLLPRVYCLCVTLQVYLLLLFLT